MPSSPDYRLEVRAIRKPYSGVIADDGPPPSPRKTKAAEEAVVAGKLLPFACEIKDQNGKAKVIADQELSWNASGHDTADRRDAGYAPAELIRDQ